jgi:hypothetical protein
LLKRFSGPEQQCKVASRQVTDGVFRFGHRQQGWRETLTAQAGRPGIDCRAAHFADRSPAFRPGLLKKVELWRPSRAERFRAFAAHVFTGA